MLRTLSRYLGLSVAVLCLVTTLATAQTMTGTAAILILALPCLRDC